MTPMSRSLPIWGKGATQVRLDETTYQRLVALGRRWHELSPHVQWPPSQVARVLLVQAGLGQHSRPAQIRVGLEAALAKNGV